VHIPPKQSIPVIRSAAAGGTRVYSRVAATGFEAVQKVFCGTIIPKKVVRSNCRLLRVDDFFMAFKRH
jgi:hypothetical protein